LVAQALPVLDLSFPTATRLWIATGPWCVAGQFLGAAQMDDAPEVVFPSGVSALTAIYEPSGVWAFEPQ
jgi:hypothetical protein